MKKVIIFARQTDYIESLRAEITAIEGEVEVVVESFTENGEDKLEEVVRISEAILPNVIFFDEDIVDLKTISSVRSYFKAMGREDVFILNLLSEGRDNRPHTANRSIYFFKGVDNLDIIRFLENIWLIDNQNNVISALYMETMDTYFDLSIRNITRDGFTFESNFLFQEGSSPIINLPFCKRYFRAHRHIIKTRRNSHPKSPYKYFYEAEYRFFTMPLKKEDGDTLKKHLRYELSSVPIGVELFNDWLEVERKQKITKLVKKDEFDNPMSEKYLDEDKYYVEPPKEIVDIGKCLYFNWLIEKGTPVGKQTKVNVSIYSKSFDGYSRAVKENSNSIRYSFRTSLIDSTVDVEKDRPDVFVLDFLEDQDFKKLNMLIKETIKYKGYFPYFILFNYNSSDVEALQHKMQYHYIISFQTGFNLDLVKKVSMLFLKKKSDQVEKKDNKRISKLKSKDKYAKTREVELLKNVEAFPSDSIPEVFPKKCLVHMVSLNEFEIVFKTTNIISVGDCFKIEGPFMLSVMVSSYIDNEESGDERFYKATIYDLKESRRQELRRYVNKVVQLQEERGEELPQDVIDSVKKLFFEKSA